MKKVKELFDMIKKYDRSFFLCMVIRNIVDSILLFFDTFMTAGIVDSLLQKAEVREVIITATVMVSINALGAVVRMLLNQEISRKYFLLRQNYQKDKTNAYMKLRYDRIETTEFVDLRQNIRYSDENMGSFMEVAYNFDRFIGNAITLLIAGGLLAEMLVSLIAEETEMAMQMGGVAVFFAILFVLSVKLTHFFQKRSGEKLPELYNDIAKDNRQAMYLAERIVFHYSMGKDIRAYRADSLIEREFQKMIDGTKTLIKEISVQGSLPGYVSVLTTRLMGVVWYVFFCYAAVKRFISAGMVFVYVNTIERFIGSLQDLLYSAHQFEVLYDRLKPVRTLFTWAEEDAKLPKEIQSEEKVTGVKSIEFADVEFVYPNTERKVLEHCSFTLDAGEKICIVGPNGAGKSTIVKLLCRLYQPLSGRIFINGVDIWEIPYREYTKLVATMFQNFKMFSFSVGENIAAGDEVNREKVIRVIDRVGLGEKGWATEEFLGRIMYRDYEDNGILCSNGEEQKLGLARCLYTEAKTVVLDEPTAALDARAEAAVYRDFSTKLSDKTVIYVSHRMSVCKQCDRILVVDNGRIVQDGKHEELVAEQDSMYRKLWNAQAQFYQ